jgi:hypothetical protein
MKLIAVNDERKPEANSYVLVLNSRGYIGIAQWDGTRFLSYQDNKLLPINTKASGWWKDKVYLTHWIDISDIPS